MRQAYPGEGEGGGHVEIEGLHHERTLGPGELVGVGASGVVDDDVYLAEGFHRPGGQRFQLGIVQDVALDRQGLGSHGPGLLHVGLKIGFGPGGEDDFGPRFGEGEADALADAAAGAGDYGYFAVEPELVCDHFSS